MTGIRYSLLNRVILRSLKAPLARAHQRIFRRHAYQAQRDYQYTDEHLKYVHILEAMNYVRVAGVPNVYFEFGCHSGRTFSAAIRAADFLGMSDTEFFAFDSFEGLPATNPVDDGVFQEGEFSTSVDEFVRLVKGMSGRKIEKKSIVKGFYRDSLTVELQGRLPKVGVVHIDVDLYSSTVEVLQFIKPLLVVGTVLIFDDWYCFTPGANKGEVRALNEFREMNPSFGVEGWKSYSTFGKSFFVTSIE